MEDNSFKVLKYYFDNGKVDLNVLDEHFSYDMTPPQFRETLNYLTGKKYLINISPHDVVYELSPLGRLIFIDTMNQHKIQNEGITIKQNLEVENLKLQNESIKYQKSIRDNHEKINDLTMLNLKLQNRQLKRYILYSFIGFFGGVLFSNLSKIMEFILSSLE
jgi:hypothetical protein